MRHDKTRLAFRRQSGKIGVMRVCKAQQPHIQPAGRETAMRVAVCVLVLLLAMAITVILGAFMSAERIEPPVRIGIESARGGVHDRLLNLSRANSPQLASVCLTELRRDVTAQQRLVLHLRARNPDAQCDLATSLAIDDLTRDLQQLAYTAAEWNGWLEDPTQSEVERTERVLVAAIGALRAWPRQWTPPPPPPRWRIVMTTRLAFMGLRDGLGAPLRPLLLLRHPDRSQYRPRALLFPYRKAPNWLYSVGFAISAVLAGYALCWLGMRLVRPWIAYVGLLYFIVAIVFLTGLVTMHAGLLK
ncbi:MAG: hypothetical protein PHR35_09590 [Kiritimatiellae bacterium]|nr:hypothetical protein [Kiritimatiellia bacterium]